MRIFWGLLLPLFRLTPRPLFSIRRQILRIAGAKVGANAHVYSSATVYFPWKLDIGEYAAIGERALIYNLGQVTIGRRSAVSHNAHLCAGSHDYRNRAMPLLRPPIFVGDDVWICADAFIGPGVTIGNGAVVAARSVVLKDVQPLDIVGGYPAKFIKKRVFDDLNSRENNN